MKRPARHRSTLESASEPNASDGPSERGPLPSRVPAVVVGIVGMVGVIGVGAASGIPAVERHLRRDVEINVLADVPSVRAEVDGRSVFLSGLVDSADDRRQLGDRVQARWGVGTVRIDDVKVRPPVVKRVVKPALTPTTGPSANPANPANPASPARSLAVSTTALRRPPDVNPIAAAVLQQRLTALRRATPIVFVRSSPAVSAGASRALDDIASALVLAALPVRIEAHSDGTGSALKNLQLSTERANAVRLALIGRGVPANLLTAVGRGDTVPVAPDATARGRELNRRIEFVVLLTRPT